MSELFLSISVPGSIEQGASHLVHMGRVRLADLPALWHDEKALALSLAAASLAVFPGWKHSKALNEQSFARHWTAAGWVPGLPPWMRAPQAMDR